MDFNEVIILCGEWEIEDASYIAIQLPRIRHSVRPSVRPSSSQKPTPGDISGTRKAIIDTLVSKRNFEDYFFFKLSTFLTLMLTIVGCKCSFFLMRKHL